MHDSELQSYRRDGFVVLPGLLDAAVVEQLSAACDHVLAQVRAASPDAGHTSTHIKGLLDPSYYTGRPELLEQLARFVSSAGVVALARDLGQPLEGELNLRTLEYFHEPSSRNYDGAWHRDGDDVELSPSASGEVVHSTLLRFRVAFAADDHLEYVRGSHLRADTLNERCARWGPLRNGPLASDAVRLVLRPGDVCLFDTWGIHRGRYRRGSARRTLDLLFGFGPRKFRNYGSLTDTLAALNAQQRRGLRP